MCTACTEHAYLLYTYIILHIHVQVCIAQIYECMVVKTEKYIIISLFSLFQMERQFEQTLKATRGLMIKKMRPDGACLFRAVGEFTGSLVPARQQCWLCCYMYLKSAYNVALDWWADFDVSSVLHIASKACASKSTPTNLHYYARRLIVLLEGPFVHVVCVCVAADQVYGDQEMHSTVRNLCLDYMVSR